MLQIMRVLRANERKLEPEKCKKLHVMRKTQRRLRSGPARKESDKKSATWPADLAASVPATMECGSASYRLSPRIARRQVCCRTPRRRQRAGIRKMRRLEN
jgi:hypothetical protein